MIHVTMKTENKWQKSEGIKARLAVLINRQIQNISYDVGFIFNFNGLRSFILGEKCWDPEPLVLSLIFWSIDGVIV